MSATTRALDDRVRADAQRLPEQAPGRRRELEWKISPKLHNLHDRFLQESREQLEKSRERELRTRSMYENLMSEVQMYQSEVGRLEREVLDEQAKDPVLSQNIRVSDRKRGEFLNLLQLSSGRRL